MKFYEHHTEPLLSSSAFARRFLKHCIYGIAIFLVTLGIGFWLFHSFAGYEDKEDALMETAMLMSGMGPLKCGAIDPEKHPYAKTMVSLYALFCGLTFTGAVTIPLVPVFHRLLHRTFHKKKESSSPTGEQASPPGFS